jgi:hypothetical protein
MPYREPPPDTAKVRLAQMSDAIDMLYHWQHRDPVIAGGALWSWAAMQPARDVDIFMKTSWRTLRKCRRLYGPVSEELMGEEQDHYGGSPVRVNRFAIETDATSIDLVLTSRGGGDITSGFDYEHCAVAFGPSCAVTFGVRAYQAGETRQLCYGHRFRRTREQILEKVQPTLWGRPEAKDALRVVLWELAAMWSVRTKEKRPSWWHRLLGLRRPHPVLLADPAARDAAIAAVEAGYLVERISMGDYQGTIGTLNTLRQYRLSRLEGNKSVTWSEYRYTKTADPLSPAVFVPKDKKTD